jgi:hypothetical protein
MGRREAACQDTSDATWALFRLKKAGLTKRIIRDPASQTGYILGDERVPTECLELIDTFKP